MTWDICFLASQILICYYLDITSDCHDRQQEHAHQVNFMMIPRIFAEIIFSQTVISKL